MNHKETSKALGQRNKIGWVFAVIGALALLFELTTTNDPVFGITFRLMGIGVGGLMLVWGLHGILSKPVLTTEAQGIRVAGWFLPQSNYQLPWDQVQKARLMTGVEGADTLWLWDTAGRLRLVEERRFDGFKAILDLVKTKLGERKIELEITQHPTPGRKAP
jgi:hypothetical protein